MIILGLFGLFWVLRTRRKNFDSISPASEGVFDTSWLALLLWECWAVRRTALHKGDDQFMSVGALLGPSDPPQKF